jgi:hypothetical protein
MEIPFTSEQFLGVFRAYNADVWPVQIALVLLAIWAIVLAMSGESAGSRLADVLLGTLWLWMGAVYHGMYFAEINPAATLFAALFIIEGLLLIYTGALRGRLTFRFRGDTAGITGLLMMFYALTIYPMIGAGSEHAFPSSPTFGLPCPTTIFTFGLFLWAEPRLHWHLLVIPLFWSVVGTIGAFRFGILEDLGLGVAAIAVLLLARFRTTRAYPTFEHPVHSA